MAPATSPPFRADHGGPLLRPPEPPDARAAFAEGRLDAAGLKEVEGTAVGYVVRLQEEVTPPA